MNINHKLLKKLKKKSINLIQDCDLRCRHISFIVKKNKILSIGINKSKTDTFAIFNGYIYGVAHSETAAIKNLQYKKNLLEGAVIINLRISRDNNRITISKPCNKCRKLIKKVGIKTIYYSNESGEFSQISL